MTITRLIKKLTYPGEEYILQKRSVDLTDLAGDSLGSLKKVWTDNQTLTGIIQKPSEDNQITRGQEETADYYGFFEPDFEIPDDELGDYRIKHVFPTKAQPFIRYFRIKTIDRNLRRRNQSWHYEITCELLKNA